MQILFVSLMLLYFNPRSPRGERPRQKMRSILFLHFNPRSPRGERQPQFIIDSYIDIFQSTLPAGGATISTGRCLLTSVFQSTLPAGGATADNNTVLNKRFRISIHAPRGGSDILSQKAITSRTNFNPRSPRGERRFSTSRTSSRVLFQSTLPAGGATFALYPEDFDIYISIHAPRGGSDEPKIPVKEEVFHISIHAPRGGSDSFRIITGGNSRHFNPRSPRGERLYSQSMQQ